jgi:hypothetical protein
MSKKKLLMILGAGSSVSLGMPSVAELDREMQTWSQSWAFPGASNYYGHLWKSLDAYYHTTPPTPPPPPLNFEIVLGLMVSLGTWVAPAPHGNPLRHLTGNRLDGLSFGQYVDFRSLGEKTLIDFQLIHLLKNLAGYMRTKSAKIDKSSSVFLKYHELLDHLSKHFEIGIYNLNYDTAAILAAPHGYTGFGADGRFQARIVHDRTAWDFVYHLHGSVCHTLIDGLSPSVAWQADFSKTFDDGDSGRSHTAASNNNSLPNTTLVAGGFKLDQLLQEPYHTFYASFVRNVWQADAILIGGYGFGDIHVNRTLRSRFAAPSVRPPVMILDFASGHDPIQFRFDHWSLGICEFLQVSDKFNVSGQTAPWSTDEIKAKETFELSVPGRTAIWYNGFSEASRRKGAIADWLAGGDDTLLAPT